MLDTKLLGGKLVSDTLIALTKRNKITWTKKNNTYYGTINNNLSQTAPFTNIKIDVFYVTFDDNDLWNVELTLAEVTELTNIIDTSLKHKLDSWLFYALTKE